MRVIRPSSLWKKVKMPNHCCFSCLWCNVRKHRKCKNIFGCVVLIGYLSQIRRKRYKLGGRNEDGRAWPTFWLHYTKTVRSLQCRDWTVSSHCFFSNWILLLKAPWFRCLTQYHLTRLRPSAVSRLSSFEASTLKIISAEELYILLLRQVIENMILVRFGTYSLSRAHYFVISHIFLSSKALLRALVFAPPLSRFLRFHCNSTVQY